MMIATVVIALALALPVSGLSPEGRVVNGDVVHPPHSFPWQLSLRSGSYHICGAVVYNSNYAITAAHCVDGGSPSNYFVACGAHDIGVSETSRQVVRVRRITIHPDYNPYGNGFPNDIAVLTLNTPLTLNSVCQPATLDTGLNLINTPTVITGWGRVVGGGRLPSKLKRGDVEALSHSDCIRYSGIVNKNYHVCVKDLRDQYYGGCNGDSGGPAQVGNTVIGLASFVWGQCMTSMPTVYTRVSNYITWIKSNTK